MGNNNNRRGKFIFSTPNKIYIVNDFMTLTSTYQLTKNQPFYLLFPRTLSYIGFVAVRQQQILVHLHDKKRGQEDLQHNGYILYIKQFLLFLRIHQAGNNARHLNVFSSLALITQSSQ